MLLRFLNLILMVVLAAIGTAAMVFGFVGAVFGIGGVLLTERCAIPAAVAGLTPPVVGSALAVWAVLFGWPTSRLVAHLMRRRSRDFSWIARPWAVAGHITLGAVMMALAVLLVSLDMLQVRPDACSEFEWSGPAESPLVAWGMWLMLCTGLALAPHTGILTEGHWRSGLCLTVDGRSGRVRWRTVWGPAWSPRQRGAERGRLGVPDEHLDALRRWAGTSVDLGRIGRFGEFSSGSKRRPATGDVPSDGWQRLVIELPAYVDAWDRHDTDGARMARAADVQALERAWQRFHERDDRRRARRAAWRDALDWPKPRSKPTSPAKTADEQLADRMDAKFARTRPNVDIDPEHPMAGAMDVVSGDAEGRVSVDGDRNHDR